MSSSQLRYKVATLAALKHAIEWHKASAKDYAEAEATEQRLSRQLACISQLPSLVERTESLLEAAAIRYSAYGAAMGELSALKADLDTIPRYIDYQNLKEKHVESLRKEDPCFHKFGSREVKEDLENMESRAADLRAEISHMERVDAKINKATETKTTNARQNELDDWIAETERRLTLSGRPRNFARERFSAIENSQKRRNRQLQARRAFKRRELIMKAKMRMLNAEIASDPRINGEESSRNAGPLVTEQDDGLRAPRQTLASGNPETTIHLQEVSFSGSDDNDDYDDALYLG